MHKKEINWVKCKNCFHRFPRMKKRIKSRSHYGLPEKVRSVNCITCCSKCSKEYNKNRQKKKHG